MCGIEPRLLIIDWTDRFPTLHRNFSVHHYMVRLSRAKWFRSRWKVHREGNVEPSERTCFRSTSTSDASILWQHLSLISLPAITSLRNISLPTWDVQPGQPLNSSSFCTPKRPSLIMQKRPLGCCRSIQKFLPSFTKSGDQSLPPPPTLPYPSRSS